MTQTARSSEPPRHQPGTCRRFGPPPWGHCDPQPCPDGGGLCGAAAPHSEFLEQPASPRTCLNLALYLSALVEASYTFPPQMPAAPQLHQLHDQKI